MHTLKLGLNKKKSKDFLCYKKHFEMLIMPKQCSEKHTFYPEFRLKYSSALPEMKGCLSTLVPTISVLFAV